MDEIRTALRTLAFLPPSCGILSRPLSDISLIWSTQDPLVMDTSQQTYPTVPPLQLAPGVHPPSALPWPAATLPAVLPLLLSLRDAKGEGGTTVGTVALAPKVLSSSHPSLTCLLLPPGCSRVMAPWFLPPLRLMSPAALMLSCSVPKTLYSLGISYLWGLVWNVRASFRSTAVSCLDTQPNCCSWAFPFCLSLSLSLSLTLPPSLSLPAFWVKPPYTSNWTHSLYILSKIMVLNGVIKLVPILWPL